MVLRLNKVKPFLCNLYAALLVSAQSLINRFDNMFELCPYIIRVIGSMIVINERRWFCVSEVMFFFSIKAVRGESDKDMWHDENSSLSASFECE